MREPFLYIIALFTLTSACKPRDEADLRSQGSLSRGADLTGPLGDSSNVLTYHNDNASTGVNTNETSLTPATVNDQAFGKLRSIGVDGQIYAQPLFVAGVNTSRGTKDLVIVATEHDSIYALDASSSMTVWTRSLLVGRPGALVTTVPAADTVSMDISPEIGITGTPVIDQSTGTLYVVAKTKDVIGIDVRYVQRLHALDLGNGQEKFGAPLVIADTSYDSASNSFTYNVSPTIYGVGDGAVGGKISFNALRQNQRAALTLANGHIFIAWASHGDYPPYHGWLMGFDPTTLALTAVFNTTPNGADGGIWQAGGKIAVDAQGFLYVATGNGTFEPTLNLNGFPISSDYGDSVLKLAVDSSTPAAPNANGWGLHVVDYFTPFNQAYLSANDADLGSSGPVLLPDSMGSPQHPHLLATLGKFYTLYLIDRDNMSHFSGNGVSDHVIQELSNPIGAMFCTPSVYGQSLFIASGTPASRANALAFSLVSGTLSPNPMSQSTDTFTWPGATLSISSNGKTGGIVWALDQKEPELRAYDASNLAQELYASHSAPNSRDILPEYTKFSVPTIAKGSVFIGAGTNLVTYGLLAANSTPPAPWTLTLNGQVTRSDVAVPIDGVTIGLMGAFTSVTSNFGDYSLGQITEYSEGEATFTVCASKLGYAQQCKPTSIHYPDSGRATATVNFAMSPWRVPTVAGTPGGRSWLQALYTDVLGRAAPDSDMNWYLKYSPRSAIALAIGHTREFRRIQVHEYYRQVLSRQVSESEGQGYITSFRSGQNEEDVLSQMYGSSEFYTSHGSTPGSFIDALFLAILQRPADNANKQAWLYQLPKLGRTGVALSFLHTDEYRRLVLIPAIFQRWLKRRPTTVETSYWASQLAHGITQSQFQAVLLGSQEYYLAALQPDSCQAFGAAFGKVPATIAELVAFANTLPQPLTLACLLRALPRPLQVNMTTSEASLQPASAGNPRIFVVTGGVTMSFVPNDPTGLLELGEAKADNATQVAAMILPHFGQFSLEEVYRNVLTADSSGTQCSRCHGGEAAVASIGNTAVYQVGTLRPDPSNDLPARDIVALAMCSDNSTRCLTLSALLHVGVEQYQFPETMPTFF